MVAQLAIAAYGHRVVLVFIEDPVVARVAVRPLIVAVAAVLVAGRVPAPSEAPSSLLTAAVGALTLATIATLARSGLLLVATPLRYAAPLSLVNLVLEPVAADLAAGHPLVVRYRVPLLEEMAKLALRRGDSAALHAALQGLERLATDYAEAAASSPAVRTLQLQRSDGSTVELEAWLGVDLAKGVERIARDAFRLQAPNTDVDPAISEFEFAASVFLGHGLHQESLACIESLIALATRSLLRLWSRKLRHRAEPPASLQAPRK